MMRVFEYGLPSGPIDGAELVDEQILLAHCYYKSQCQPNGLEVRMKFGLDN